MSQDAFYRACRERQSAAKSPAAILAALGFASPADVAKAADRSIEKPAGPRIYCSVCSAITDHGSRKCPRIRCYRE